MTAKNKVAIIRNKVTMTKYKVVFMRNNGAPAKFHCNYKKLQLQISCNYKKQSHTLL